MDTTKTMRQLCADEPKLEAFLQSKGFPFSPAKKAAPKAAAGKAAKK